MSTQRLNIYLRDKTSTTTTPLLPGTNTNAAGAWKYAIVADGRYNDSRFGSGLYGADLARAADAQLQVISPSKIVSSVPAAALEGIDLQNTGYQVSMFSDAEDGEGIGNVRPVYSADCWNGVNCPSFVQGYRFGGGKGNWTDTNQARDTDVTDSNAIDIISGNAAQATVMNPATGTAVAPYVTLDTAQTTIDTAFSVTSKKIGNQQVVTITAKNNGATPVTVSIKTPIGNVKAGTLQAGASKTFTVKTGLKKIPSFTAKATVTAPDGTTRDYNIPYKATAK